MFSVAKICTLFVGAGPEMCVAGCLLMSLAPNDANDQLAPTDRPNQPDSGGDPVPDDRNECVGTPTGTRVGSNGCLTVELSDSVGDGIPDDRDNCPSLANPEQVDADEDGKANECDGSPWGSAVSFDYGISIGAALHADGVGLGVDNTVTRPPREFLSDPPESVVSTDLGPDFPDDVYSLLYLR